MIDDPKALAQRTEDRASETERLAKEAIEVAFSARVAYLNAAMDLERASGRGASKFFKELQAQWRFVAFKGRQSALESFSKNLWAYRSDRLVHFVLGR